MMQLLDESGQISRAGYNTFPKLRVVKEGSALLGASKRSNLFRQNIFDAFESSGICPPPSRRSAFRWRVPLPPKSDTFEVPLPVREARTARVH
jgi:hypothetical protein